VFLVPGRGLPVELRLAYNADHHRDLLARRPRLESFLFHPLLRDAAGNVVVVWGDGRQDRFTTSGGGFTAPPGVYPTLTAPATGELR